MGLDIPMVSLYIYICILLTNYKKENGIQSVQKTFQHKKTNWNYWVFEVSTQPDINFGTVGDISVENNGERFWVRLSDRWELASRDLGAHGRPLQKHPILMGERRLCEDKTWKSQTHWNVKGVQKKIQRDDVEGGE
jgi:hypothetical protein